MTDLSPRFRISKPLLVVLLICLAFWNLGLGGSAAGSNQSLDTTGTLVSETETSTDTASLETAITETETSTDTATEEQTVTELPSLTPASTATSTSETSSATPTVTPTPTDTSPPLYFNGSYSSDEVVIRLGPAVSLANIQPCLDEIGGTVDSGIEELDVSVIEVPVGTVSESIARLEICPGVDYAEPNYIAQIDDTIPLDPGWVNQYGLPAIRAPQGWDLSTGSASVTIAIVDTGVDLSHPDLAAKLVPGYNFVSNDSIPQDDNGHGTHVAGIAAAISNNGIGVAGVSWGARIMPVKVLNAFGNGSFADVAAGIIWATDHGAQIVNLSLGGSNPSLVLEDAVNYAYARGVTLIAACGNSGNGFVLYPARYPHVIAVAATDSSNSHAGFSNFGANVDVAAPGVAIYSTDISSSRYAYRTGTSMSAAYVSGLAAILRGIPGSGSPDGIAWEIESTALDLGIPGRDDLYGYGLIQMDAAIRLVWPTPTPTNTPTYTPAPTGTPTATSIRQAIFTPRGFSFTASPKGFSFTATTTRSSADSAVHTITPGQASLFTMGTPSLTATGAAAQKSSPSGREPGIPTYCFLCMGIVLIGVGVALFWYEFRLRKDQRSRSYSAKKTHLTYDKSHFH